MVSTQHWNRSASEYSPDFPFWHRTIEPRNLSAAKSHTPGCKLCYSFAVGMDQKGGPLTWGAQLEGGFQGLIYRIGTAGHFLTALFQIAPQTIKMPNHRDGPTSLEIGLWAAHFCILQGWAEIREAKEAKPSSQHMPDPSSGNHHDL